MTAPTDAELARMVAERVLNWKLVENRGSAGGRYWQVPPYGAWEYGEFELPDFPNDIAQAWRVVDHLSGYKFALERYTNEWEARFTDANSADFPGYADTAPRAICLAALEAQP